MIPTTHETVSPAPDAAWMLRLRDTVQEWLRQPEWWATNHRREKVFVWEPKSAAYADLMFAIGFARLGAREASDSLRDGACPALLAEPGSFVPSANEPLSPRDQKRYLHWQEQRATEDPKVLHQAILHLFEYRRQQVLQGVPHAGATPDEWTPKKDALGTRLLFMVDRLRQKSRILEPEDRINPYRFWGARLSGTDQLALEIEALNDRDEIAKRTRELLAGAATARPGERCEIFRTALRFARRAGAGFVLEVLSRLLETPVSPAASWQEAQDQGWVFQVALVEAARLETGDILHRLFTAVGEWLRGQPLLHALWTLPAPDEETIPPQRLHLLADGVERILTEVVGWEPVSQVTGVFAPEREPDAIRNRSIFLLLFLAGNWSVQGRGQTATAVLDAARRLLTEGDGNKRDRTEFARAYAVTLRWLPAVEARARLEALFADCRGIDDTYSTGEFYNLSRLEVTDAAVRTAAVLSRPTPDVVVSAS
jgi:hypothetical protein